MRTSSSRSIGSPVGVALVGLLTLALAWSWPGMALGGPPFRPLPPKVKPAVGPGSGSGPGVTPRFGFHGTGRIGFCGGDDWEPEIRRVLPFGVVIEKSYDLNILVVSKTGERQKATFPTPKDCHLHQDCS